MGLHGEVVDSVTDANQNQWNNVVEHADHGTLFHRFEWLAAVEDGLSGEPRHVVVSKNGNPVALMPTFRRTVDLPVSKPLAQSVPFHELVSSYPGFGGPLILSNKDECIELLLDEIPTNAGLRTAYHTIRVNDLGHTQYGKALNKRGYQPDILTCRIRVGLDRDWADIQADMKKERRNALRQAHEQSWEIREEPLDHERLRHVHDGYRANMDRVGSTAYPFSFFEALGSHLEERIKIFTAVVDGEAVGTFVFFLDDEQSTIHYFFSAIRDEAHYEYYPADLLHEHAIKWGIDHGYDWYDFGDSPADFSDGLFRYKRKYGGEIVPTIQWQRGASRLAWPVFKAGRAIYQKATY